MLCNSWQNSAPNNTLLLANLTSQPPLPLTPLPNVFPPPATPSPQVLTIGATNLAQELDQALLRPGRFEVVYEIPSPGPTARMEILKYHSRCAPGNAARA